MRDRMKFRAWDKENKKYIYGVENGLQFYSTVGNLRIMTLAEIEKSDKYELEQCTGFKDKNGKLIYEGDIILFEEGSCEDDCWNDVVIFDNEKGVLRFKDSFYPISDGTVGVVNGNIHENSALLRTDD